MKQKNTAGHVVIIAVLIVCALISLYPLWYTICISMSERAYVEGGMVYLWPKGFTLVSYAKLLRDTTFFKSFLVSVERVALGLLVNMTCIVLTAYPMCLPEGKFRGAKFFKWFFMANMLFSGGMIPSYMLIRQYKLFDSIWSMILPGAVPLSNVILMMNYFRNVPYELNEAATIDGANPWQIMMKIYVPLSKASLACIALFQFVSHWNAWFDGLIYINDQTRQPLQTYIYQISAQVDYSTMTSEQIMEAMLTSDTTLNAAKVIIALIPVLLIYPFLQKHFVVGMTLGAVKG